MNSKIKKNFVWNMIGSTIYSFTSLIFMIIVTRINGVKEAGVFTFAFSFACMLQVIGNYAGRSYHVTDNDKNINDYDYIYQRVITCILMLVVSVGFVLIKGYTLFKIGVIILLILYKMLDSFSEVIYGVLQKNDDLYKVGISLFLKSVISIVLFFIVDYFTKSLVSSIIVLILISGLVILIYDLSCFKEYNIKRTNLDFSKIKTLFIGGVFVFVFTFLTQYVCNASKYAIDDLMKEEFQTVFGIILMPATFLLLCSQLIVQPFLVTIKKYVNVRDYSSVLKLVFKICLFVFGIGLMGEVCCYFLGIPFLNFIYSISLDEYLIPLLIIIGGAIFYGMSTVISTSLIAMKKNFIQTIFYVVSSLFAMVSSYYLVLEFGIIGAALSYLFTMIILFILYLISFIYYCRGNYDEKNC